MSKYSHFEMCEKIFGSRYKFNEAKELVPYSRTDMWNKLIEQQEEIKRLTTVNNYLSKTVEKLEREFLEGEQQ